MPIRANYLDTFAAIFVTKNTTMKRLLPLYLLLLSSPIFAVKQIDVTSSIKQVTVFLNGAMVERKAVQLVEEGSSQLHLTDLTAELDPNSIQVSAKGDVTILSVSHQVDYLNERKKPRNIIIMEDSLRILTQQYNQTRSRKSVFEEEKSMILSNKKIEPGQTGFAVEDLEDLADFYRERLLSITTEILTLSDNEMRLGQDLDRIKNQLAEFNSTRNKPTSEIIIDIASNSKTVVQVSFSYYVHNAGWSPIYDIRAYQTQVPLLVKYNANVWQSTGEDWSEVMLTLSSGNPILSNTKPDLQPWRLYFLSTAPRFVGTKNATYLVADAYESRDDKEAMPMQQFSKFEESSAAAKSPEVYTDESGLNVNFSIKVPYDVPSDSKNHLVNIDTYEIPATFIYNSVPKLDAAAFLIAQATGWDKFNLMSGNANLYYQDTYIGQSYLSTANTNDTLSISLGRDKGIVIERKKVNEFCDSKTIGSSKKESLAFEITIRNTKKTAVTLVVEDQIPLSTNKEIEVTVIETGNATYNAETGILTWNISLDPGKSEKMMFKYSVKLPKEKTVRLN